MGTLENKKSITDSGYRFSRISLDRLNTCHTDIIKVMQLAIRRSEIDFGISCGHRTIKEQKALYAKGRTIAGNIITNVDGVKSKSKHNHKPALGIDIYIYDNEKKYTFNEGHLAYVAGVVMSCAKELFERGETCNLVTWGGNWDNDGIIIYDQNLLDMPHFEIREV